MNFAPHGWLRWTGRQGHDQSGFHRIDGLAAIYRLGGVLILAAAAVVIRMSLISGSCHPGFGGSCQRNPVLCGSDVLACTRDSLSLRGGHSPLSDGDQPNGLTADLCTGHGHRTAAARHHRPPLRSIYLDEGERLPTDPEQVDLPA